MCSFVSSNVVIFQMWANDIGLNFVCGSAKINSFGLKAIFIMKLLLLKWLNGQWPKTTWTPDQPVKLIVFAQLHHFACLLLHNSLCFVWWQLTFRYERHCACFVRKKLTFKRNAHSKGVKDRQHKHYLILTKLTYGSTLWKIS